MKENNGVSLIIPIYNVEDYIADCLESVIESLGTLQNVQVILVDDGSQDDSGKVAEKYADAYKNFFYVRKENGGIADARNYGLRYVQYSYVAFLDSDDWVHESYFQKIFDALEREPDMIIFDWMDVLPGRDPEIVKGMDFRDAPWSVLASVCNKVFKTSSFKEIEFPTGQVYEDVGTMYKLLYYTNNYLYISEPLYIYRKNRKGSIMNTFSPSINDIYGALEGTYEFYAEKGALTEENRKGLCYQYVKLLCWSNMYRQLQYYRYDFWSFYRKMKGTRKLVYERFPEWKDNEYLIRNAPFFEERLGSDYINKLDRIGRSFLSTLQTVFLLVSKNRKRLAG